MTLEDRVKLQIGSLVVAQLMLQVANEELQAENEKLKEKKPRGRRSDA